MALLEKWTPLRELDLMDRRMRRFFEDLGFVTPSTPAADVYENDDELVVELEVPGFDEKELAVEIADHMLAIKGDRTETTEKKAKSIRLRERLEAHFERRFELPAEIDPDHVRANYEKGVLTLHVPKTSEQKPIAVPIETA